ncbi:Holliday junction resolvase RuvX [bacterium]|nr:Holliday junction resolvase RuvX [bacterium]
MSGGEHVGVALDQVFLGIDPGEKRIGIALKAAGRAHAEPLLVIERDATTNTQIAKLADTYKCDTLIVGLPRNSDGNDTAQTKWARAFAGELADATDLHIIMYDEFGTTERARQRLGARTREQEKKILDAYAAAVLIEDYIGSLV